ncbi:MAG: S8 family serine peptidase [Bdellovibrionota bacterium]
MKTSSRALLALALLATAACSNDNKPLQQALQKEHPKNLIAEKVLSSSREVDNWFTKDPEIDQAEGTSADKAYDLLNLQHKKEIIVAVIDSGVDIHHEDLQGKIWTNKGEIANNGIDDDANGYVDDVSGWNFIGGVDANGKPTHIDAEQLEVTRELIKMKSKKKSLEDQGMSLSEKDQAYFDKLDAEVKEALVTADQMLEVLGKYIADLKTNYEVLKDLLKVSFEQVSLVQVSALATTTEAEAKAKENMVAIFKAGNAKDVARFLRVQGVYADDKNYYYNEQFLPRAEIVKDEPENFDDVTYGNNDVIGPGADHGTHVAGIIAADRNNSLGVRGVAQNVKIMALRVVPNGDERDKDVALAVKYAADNGANVINMSFGKGYSPQRTQVGEAFKYAEEKGLLIMHAAGNESTDRDQEDRYPTRRVYSEAGEVIDTVGTWLDVGASSQFKDRTLTATFTNFGQTQVDLFAPGVNLNSTVPGNKYAVFSGTSMACPSAAGVAALVWSQMPELSAQELKARLMGTVRSRAGLSVRLPSDHAKDVPFETLSITGGISDAYSAIVGVMTGVAL